MPFLSPMPINLKLPSGESYQCEGIMSPSIDSDMGAIEITGLKVPISLHQQREIILNGETISLEEIKEEILYLINEGIEVSETGTGVKFEADKSSMQQKPVNQYFGLATYDALINFSKNVKDNINSAVITDNPFTHKAIAQLAADMEVFPFMLTSDDLTPESEQILKNNITHNPKLGALKAAVYEFVEKSQMKSGLASTLINNIKSRVVIPAEIESAVLDRPDMNISDFLSLSKQVTSRMQDFNALSVESACLQDAKKGAVTIKGEELHLAMPLVEVSSELASQQINSYVHGEHLNGTVYFEVSPMNLASGESTRTPIALAQPNGAGKYTLMQGANLEQLGRVLERASQAPVHAISTNRDNAYEQERPRL